MTPLNDGVRLDDRMAHAQGFSAAELRDVMYQLNADPDQAALLVESCDLDEADAMLNPGADLIVEAVTAVKNQLDRTMSAMVRVFNRHSGSVKPYDFPSIGPDRKNALFAYKTTTFTFDDGQTVSILFHSPGRDPMKLKADDTLIAYRWMLNRRDITATVAPERGRDLNLQTMAKRIMQLVQENSEKFQANNAKRQEQQEKLATLESEQQEVSQRADALTQENATLAGEVETAEQRIERLRARLAEVGEGGRESGGDEGSADAGNNEGDGTSADESSDLPRDPTTPEEYAKIIAAGDEAKASYQDQLDSFFQSRVIDVRNALRDLGWEGERYDNLSKNGSTLKIDTENVGAGANVVGVTYVVTTNKVDTGSIQDDLTRTPVGVAKAIDAYALPAESENDEAETLEQGVRRVFMNNAGAVYQERDAQELRRQVQDELVNQLGIERSAAATIYSIAEGNRYRRMTDAGRYEQSHVELQDIMAAVQSSTLAQGDDTTGASNDDEGTASQEGGATEPDNLEALDTGLYRDISRSISVIRGIDDGTEQGYNRSLFTSSIANKLKTQARNGNEDVVDAALLLIAQQSIEHGKPILAKRNAIWKATGRDMDYYTEIAKRKGASEESGTPAPGEQQGESPEPTTREQRRQQHEQDESRYEQALALLPQDIASETESSDGKPSSVPDDLWNAISDERKESVTTEVRRRKALAADLAQGGMSTVSTDGGTSDYAMSVIQTIADAVGDRVKLSAIAFNVGDVNDAGLLSEQDASALESAIEAAKRGETPTPSPEAEDNTPSEVDRIGAALQGILQETDSQAAIDAIEQLMDEAEAAGIDIDNDPDMLAASDHITKLLEQEAA